MGEIDFNYYSYAYIRLKNLKNNLKIIKSRVKKGTKILIPVKSNAYGCGIVEVSKFLETLNIDYLGVAFPFEGFFLRKNGIKLPILVFSEIIYKEDYEKVVKYKLTPTIFTLESLKIFNSLGKTYNKKINIHINIDTGMGRVGIKFEDFFEFFKKIQKFSYINIEGIYSHLSAADEKNKSFTREQIRRFQKVVDYIKKESLNIPYIHLLNSAGIINYPEYSYTMVRPGIIFYGYFPDNKIRKNILIKPSVDLKAKVVYIKKTKKNEAISYGHTYYTYNNEVIATIGCGYGDGINRLLSNTGYVLYKDVKCDIRGRVCMDQFMVNISKVKNPKKGEMVTIFGRDINSEIKLENIAKKLRTIPYEILCLMGNRVKRIYIS